MSNTYVIPLFVAASILLLVVVSFLIGILFVQKTKQNNFKRRILEGRAEENERTVNEISKNLHDDVAQYLSLMRANLGHMAGMGIQKIEEDLQSATTALNNVMTDVRHISHTLSADWLRDRGLVGAISEDIEHINATHVIDAKIIVEGEEYELKPDIELAVFRITKEVINNMLKHSRATVFSIRMVYQPEQFTLVFTDNGTGFNPQAEKKDKGIGLVNMHSRAGLLEGNLKVDTAPNKGCRTVFNLPVTEKNRGPIYAD